MIDNTIREGGCLCGKVRFKVFGKPVRANICHCSQCRKAAGAPYLALAEFPAEAVTWTKGLPAYFGSSDAAERGFCEHCGTTLTFCYIDGDTIDLSISAFDDPSAFPPEEHLWISSKVSWVTLDDDLPKYPRERGSS